MLLNYDKTSLIFFTNPMTSCPRFWKTRSPFPENLSEEILRPKNVSVSYSWMWNSILQRPMREQQNIVMNLNSGWIVIRLVFSVVATKGAVKMASLKSNFSISSFLEALESALTSILWCALLDLAKFHLISSMEKKVTWIKKSIDKLWRKDICIRDKVVEKIAEISRYFYVMPSLVHVLVYIFYFSCRASMVCSFFLLEAFREFCSKTI